MLEYYGMTVKLSILIFPPSGIIHIPYPKHILHKMSIDYQLLGLFLAHGLGKISYALLGFLKLHVLRPLYPPSFLPYHQLSA